MALRAAKAWGLTPRQWREQSLDDQALMLAFDMFEGTRDAYREEYREDRRDKKPTHAQNEFEAMRRMLGRKES